MAHTSATLGNCLRAHMFCHRIRLKTSFISVLLAQWRERRFSKSRAGGSNPPEYDPRVKAFLSGYSAAW